MNNLPIKSFQFGSIRASIWENRDNGGKTWHNIVISKSLSDGKQFKETNSFNLNELPVVSKAADLAYAWIWAQRNRTARSSEEKANG